jgi:hypothetical protein
MRPVSLTRPYGGDNIRTQDWGQTFDLCLEKERPKA